MLPASSATNFRVQWEPQEEKKVVPGSEHVESPDLALALPRQPTLDSRMIEHKVAQACEQQKPFSTLITREELNVFRAFFADWLTHPIPTNWVNAEETLRFQKVIPNEKAVDFLTDVCSSYQILYPIYTKGKLNKMNAIHHQQRKKFAEGLWMIAALFTRNCERDCESKAGKSVFQYKKYYSKEIHPHFLVLQRLCNFLHLMLEKEGAVELLRNPLGAIAPFELARLGFFKEKQGYIPICWSYEKESMEAHYIYYGEMALPSEQYDLQVHVFLFDRGEMVMQRGILLGLKKTNNPQKAVEVEIRGFFGAEDSPPFFVSGATMDVGDFSDPKVKVLMTCIEEEILAFLSKKECRHDLFFVPLIERGKEGRQFAYCLLQDLLVRSQNKARPDEQKMASEFLKQIEAIEEQPVADIVKNLEGEIKADLRTGYERQVEEEQRLRSQRVSEGKIEGAGLSKKAKKGNKREKKKSQPEEAPLKSVDERVEEAFQEIKVKGRVKFRTILKMAQKILKQHPDTFLNALQGEKQQGSHHVLHMEQGSATIVEPHGKRDRTLSPKSANRFLGALMDQVKKVFNSQP